MASDSRIIIAAKPRKPISVELAGVDYVVTPVKSTVAIALAERIKAAGEDPGKIMTEIENYVGLIFGNKQKAKVMARLRKEDDDLDIPDIMELMTKLAEAGSANPST